MAHHVQLFWWKVCWGWLPCKSLLHERGIVHLHDATCDLCNTDNEDIQHRLFSCHLVASIWQTLQSTYLHQYAFHSLPDYSRTLICYTAHHIWNARNNFIFQRISHSAGSILSEALQFVQFYYEAHCPSHSTINCDQQHWGIGDSMNPISAPTYLVSWIPPPYN